MMTKLVALLALICLWSGCSNKNAIPHPPTAEKTPVKNRYGFNRVLSYETTLVELGEVRGKELVERSISVKNKGADTVQIQNVHTSCPCCQAMLSDLEIPAGAETQLNMALDPTKASERFSVLITVEYMDKEMADRVQVTGQLAR